MPYESYCLECHNAHSFIFTSVDDARQGIKAERNPIVLQIALDMESKKQIPRVAMIKLLNSRLQILHRDGISKTSPKE